MGRLMLIVCIIIMYLQTMNSQDIFSLDEAIVIALRQNFGIQIAKMETDVAEMQIYPANAGLGPIIDIVGNMGLTGNNVDLTFLDGNSLNRYGYVIAPNVGLNVTIPLYDGNRGKTILERLKKEKEFADLESQLAIQNVLIEVISAYYDVILQQEIEQYLLTIIAYYEDRLRITEERWKLGRGSKLEYLQSRTDLNTQLSELALAQNNLKNNKIRLNYLLNRDLYTEFKTENIISLRKDYDLAELLDDARYNNRDLRIVDKMRTINEIRDKEIDAGSRPQIFFNGNGGFNFTQSNTGFLLRNRNTALSGSISAVWNIFDGQNRKKQIAINQLNTRIIENQKENLMAQVISELVAAFNRFNSDKEILRLEQENKELAEENLNISLEKFKLGGSTILELNEDQQRYDNALNRLVTAQYNIKITELEMLRLSGGIY